jgi:23S rRNA (uridine2552-2'-O)-methyltransferase
MTRKDRFYNQAKQEGYRTRSAYKLKQIDQQSGLFGPGNTVVDLGAAPGGWLQVAAEKVGEQGTVVGVDFQRIKELEDVPATVELVKGDMTEDDTKSRVREVAGGDVDVVLSDMAPNMTGEYGLDHARSVHLARQALEIATVVLGPGGDVVAKLFDGRDLEALEDDIDRAFEYVRQVRPEASRAASSELYLVGKGRLTAPVRAGDERTVEIVDTGDEGDGIARVDGFTLFVSGAAVGETHAVRVTDVRPRYGFAEPR